MAVIEGGQVFFVRTDHIGRPVFATDSDGLKVWEASYLPFGGVHVSTGAINLRFPGQWFQSESVYGYALGNPGRWVDPTGEAIPLAPVLVGIGLGAGLALIEELLRNGGRWDCVNWFVVGIGGGMGAVGGAYVQGAMKGLALAHRAGDAAARQAVRRAYGAGADDVVHHAILRANRGVNGTGGSLRHHYMNLCLRHAAMAARRNDRACSRRDGRATGR